MADVENRQNLLDVGPGSIKPWYNVRGSGRAARFTPRRNSAVIRSNDTPTFGFPQAYQGGTIEQAVIQKQFRLFVAVATRDDPNWLNDQAWYFNQASADWSFDGSGVYHGAVWIAAASAKVTPPAGRQWTVINTPTLESADILNGPVANDLTEVLKYTTR
jgi:hypothetical protein